ncbi:MAG TPA: phytoene/squalene synthase family protein, partial [Anaerolineales bacterium]|nr:phytoene/squalene synthase family protein [Anaerolineales bacterium]
MQIQANWENQLLAMAGNVPHPHTRPFFSYWAGDISLQKAYKEAEKITAGHSKSFHFASGLLPEEKRASVRALYAFCRTVDDIVDESADGQREAQLDYWRTMVKTASFADDDLIAAAWSDTLSRYHIPRHYALQLIDGVARDLSQSRYQTFEELATYCYGVASTVGLMSMYIVGFHTNEAVPYAIKLGVALQMTNILRDVGEDYRNGRLYLPREELVYYGIQESDIADGHMTHNWRQFMKFQIERTRQLYAESWAGVKLLEREGQL